MDGSSDEAGATQEGLDGRPVSEAVDLALSRDESRDPDVVRATLERLSSDGVVSRGALSDELGRVSKVVATPETRVELATDALDEAREAAEPVDEFDAVQGRLSGFEAELDALQQQADSLSRELRSIIDERSEASLYETCRALDELTAAANETAQAADTLTLSLEEFEDWLDSPAVRFDSLEADVDDLEGSVEDLTDLVDDLEAALDGTENADDLGPDWAVLTVRRRVFSLMLADLSAELASLRRWHDQEGIEHDDRADDVAERLDALESTLSSLDGRLSNHEDRWGERFDSELQSFERTIDDHEPPVDWAAVQPTLESHYESIETLRQ